MLWLKALLASSVLVICSGKNMEELSKHIEDIFTVFEYRQNDILEKIAGYTEDIKNTDVTSGASCERVDELKSKLDELESIIQDHYQHRNEYLEDFATVFRADECTNGDHNCHANAICTDLILGFKCTCRDGFSGDGRSCQDVDECTNGQHLCDENAVCNNVPGSYWCTCKPGFQGDGRTCQDTNECISYNNCHRYAICSNTEGNYTCSCNSGFRGDGYTCEDVDECEEKLYDCQPNSFCNNIRGSYSCICDPGYEGDEDTCKEVDECLGDNDCHTNAMCNNTEGSYKCSCHIGYRGDGYQCEDMCPHKRVNDAGCIFFEHGVARTWLEARDNCEKEGGRLFSAVSPHSLSKLQQYLRKIPIPDWIGLWVGVYNNTWLGDNGGRGVSSEECSSCDCPTSGLCCGSLLSGPQNFGLNNDPCDRPRFSICQWNETSFQKDF